MEKQELIIKRYVYLECEIKELVADILVSSQLTQHDPTSIRRSRKLVNYDEMIPILVTKITQFIKESADKEPEHFPYLPSTLIIAGAVSIASSTPLLRESIPMGVLYIASIIGTVTVCVMVYRNANTSSEIPYATKMSNLLDMLLKINVLLKLENDLQALIDACEELMGCRY